MSKIIRNPDHRIANAMLVAEYWQDTVDNLQIKEFSRVFLEALSGETDATKLGIPVNEYRERMRSVLSRSHGYSPPLGTRTPSAR